MIVCLCFDFSPNCAGCGAKATIKEIKAMIVDEIRIAQKEHQLTSRLTSIYNKVDKMI